MLLTVEGRYQHGKVELSEFPPGVGESRVIVTFLPAAPHAPATRMMQLGQFAGPNMSTEKDFRLAEWHGEVEGSDAD